MDKLDTEQNKQIVQNALNERADKRKGDMLEAEHDAITTQIFKFVNDNEAEAERKRLADEAKEKLKRQISEAEAAERKRKKKIAALKKRGKLYMLSVYASMAQIGAGLIAYIFSATELWCMIVSCVLAVAVLTTQIILLLENSRKISRLM